MDNNGTLDKEEFKLFIQECANLLGSDNSTLFSLQSELKNVNVEEAFKTSDTDRSGAISRTEMFSFLEGFCDQEEMNNFEVTQE